MEDNSAGTTTIAPSVLNTITRLTTLGTPGVSRMSSYLMGGSRHAPRKEFDGVKVIVKDNKIFLDVYVVISSGQNVRLVAENIQNRVLRAISEMVGMEVADINVHVADVDVEA